MTLALIQRTTTISIFSSRLPSRPSRLRVLPRASSKTAVRFPDAANVIRLRYDPTMKYRILGNTGLRVSVIGVGTWQLGGEWGKDFSQDEVDRMLGRAKELGINLIDTAECYG